MFKNFGNRIIKWLSEFKTIKSDLGLNINPNRDWKLFCLSLGLGLLIIFFADYYLFYNIDVLIGNIGSPQASITSDFNIKKLNNIVTDWESKVKEFNLHADIVPDVIDPSL